MRLRRVGKGRRKGEDNPDRKRGEVGATGGKLGKGKGQGEGG